MRRLYFLIPTVDSAKKIVDELLLARIEQRHIHIAAADHHALLEAKLPEAGLLQESDFIPAVERGLAIGGATGILAGIAAVALPGVGLVLGGGAILGIGLAGAGLGALLSLASPGLGITVGLGFYLPFSIVLTYSIGTLLRVVSDWKLGDAFSESTGIPIAAGVIVGEALVGVGFAVYMILGAAV